MLPVGQRNSLPSYPCGARVPQVSAAGASAVGI